MGLLHVSTARENFEYVDFYIREGYFIKFRIQTLCFSQQSQKAGWHCEDLTDMKAFTSFLWSHQRSIEKGGPPCCAALAKSLRTHQNIRELHMHFKTDLVDQCWGITGSFSRSSSTLHSVSIYYQSYSLAETGYHVYGYECTYAGCIVT